MAKRVLAILLILFLLTSLQVVFADGGMSGFDCANALKVIGVFKGTDKGFELDRAPTRLEGLIMLVRLLGKVETANNQCFPDSGFSDVPVWGVNIVNYAKAAGLTNGISANEFGSNLNLTCQDYATFLLRALDLSKQSSWQTAKQDIVQLTEVNQDDIPNGTFLRRDVARLSYKILQSDTVNGEMLLKKLVREKAIDQQSAALIEQLMSNSTTIDEQLMSNSITVDEQSMSNSTVTKDDSTATPATNISAYEQAVFELTNAERQKHGIAPLKYASANVDNYADVRTDEIMTLFSHTRPNGESSLDNFKDIRTAGENIAKGQTTPEDVVAKWMNSPMHRANILNEDFVYLAVGFKNNHWVQLFYTPLNE